MNKKKSLLFVLVLVLVLVTAAGGTFAWLVSASGTLENNFIPGEVPVSINEDFTDGGAVKENLSVTNDGNVPAYIRVALIPAWMDTDGNLVGEPARISDISFTLGTGWIQIGEYYYYTQPVAPGAATANLADSITVATATAGNGYHMYLQIAADSIQAEPAGAVEGMWPVSVAANGTLGEVVTP